MAHHIELGRLGEKLAEEYLAQRGYTIMYRNWRYSHYELDIIAEKADMIHFIEVKIRSSAGFGQPEESVTPGKIKKLMKAIDQFLFLHQHYPDFRIDILSITTHAEKQAEYFLIEDAYAW